MAMNNKFAFKKRRYNKNYRRNPYKSEDKYFGLLIQAEVCIIILLVVFVISFANNSVTNRIKNQLKNAIALTYTYDDILKIGSNAIDRIFDNTDDTKEESPLNTNKSPKETTLPNQTIDGLLLQEEL